MAGVPEPVRVAALARYPVKSLTGVTVPSLDLDARGVVGDRRWAVRTADGGTGSGKRTRRFQRVPGLLELRAVERHGLVLVALPDGTAAAVDDEATAALLSAHLGQPVTLAEEEADTHYDDGPVSLLGAASVAAVEAEAGQPVDAERFRPNVLLTGLRAFAEDELVGRQVRLGTALLAVTMTSYRCAMVDAETADLPSAPGVLRAVGQVHDACLGVVADVVEPGVVRVGDALR